MEKLKAWFSPGIVIQLVATVLTIGTIYGAWSNRLAQQEERYQALTQAIAEQGKSIGAQVADLRGELRDIKNSQLDVIRTQERMAAMGGRVDILERFSETQTQFNALLAARVARLEK